MSPRLVLLAAIALSACDSAPSTTGADAQADAQGDGAGDDADAGDISSPVVTITSPAESDGATYTLTGTASDNVAVVSLAYVLTGEEPVALDPAATFEVELQLSPPRTTIRVLARDAADNLGVDEITVAVGPNQAPTATGASLSLLEDEPLEINLNAGDPDDDDLAFAFPSPPAHGALDTSAAPTVIYTPNPNYHGSDTFTFQVNDGALSSEVATFTLTIEPVNDKPVAADDEVELAEDGAIDIVLGATDVDGDLLSVSITDGVSHGVLVARALRTFRYTPTPNYFGPDSFSFEVGDGTETDTATVSIAVVSVNDPPHIAVPASPVVTDEDEPVQLTLLGSDVETAAPALAYVVVDEPELGTVAIEGNIATYTPNPDAFGDDPISFAASDGEDVGEVGAVTVSITPINDPPVTADLDLETREDTPIALTLPGTDLETARAELTFQILNGPAAQTGTLEGSGADWTFLPELDYYGSAEITWSVSDGEETNQGTATITIHEGSLLYVERTEGSDAQTGLHPDEPLRTLGEAISRADLAGPDELPDTVYVGAGRYCEQGLIVDRSVAIAGAGIDATILDASSEALDCEAPAPAACFPRAQTGPAIRITRDVEASTTIAVSLSDLTVAHAANRNGQGGGIYNEEALRLERVRLTDNCATDGGGLANVRYDDGAWGSAVLVDCEVVGNGTYVDAPGRGAGLFNGGEMTLENTLVADNAPERLGPAPEGGGIATAGDDIDEGAGLLTLMESTVSGNLGGGIRLDDTSLSLVDSEITGNDASFGGGLQVFANVRLPTLTMTRSGITGNTAHQGGGLYIFGEIALSLEDSVIEGNVAEEGGGAYARNVPVLSGLAVRFNHATERGGGMHVATEFPVEVESAVVEGNTAPFGGGISTSGSVAILGSTILDNHAVYEGGGLSVLFGALTVEDTAFEGNRAEPTPADCDEAVPPCDPESSSGQQLGGAIATRDDLTLDDVDFDDNRAADAGGALAVFSSALDVNLCRFDGNRAEAGEIAAETADGYAGRGGAIYLVDPEGAVIADVDVSGSVAGELGGAMFIEGGKFDVYSSTFVDNFAGSESDDARGGALYLRDLVGAVYNSTFEGNRALDEGAVIYLDESPELAGTDFDFIACTITANGAVGEAPACIQGIELVDSWGSIYAYNEPQSCLEADPLASDGDNIDMDGSCELTEDELTGVDPMLEPLGAYGGPTRTRPPMAGSPAIDATLACEGPGVDQRGAARPIDGDDVPGARCDIGSVEYP